MDSIYITKTFLPPFEEYVEKIKPIWDSHQVTNDGPLYQEFENDIKSYTNTGNVVCLNNGTIALQIAIRALGLSGEVITTPFTHYATSGSLIWENCTPVYADIEEDTFNIDVAKIEEKINDKTTAIMAVHVFGNPCDVDAIQEVANRYNLKLIYDAAHAFGVNVNGNSIMTYGDISMASFNATKLLHTFEGGALFVNNSEMEAKVRKLAYYGMDQERTITQTIGTNAKMIELSAAMGILNLQYIDKNLKIRRNLYEAYVNKLSGNSKYKLQKLSGESNHSYMPIVFETSELKNRVIEKLINNNIFPKKYFYPSLELIFNGTADCHISYDISNRILCLPMSDYLSIADIDKICQLINQA